MGLNNYDGLILIHAFKMAIWNALLYTIFFLFKVRTKNLSETKFFHPSLRRSMFPLPVQRKNTQ
jgi:hypothetical protein